MPISLVLASASPARRALLRQAGVEAGVIVSSVDEQAVLEGELHRRGAITPSEAALVLARAKCENVATVLLRTPADAGRPDLVLGCDSLLDVDGDIVGKPATAEAALRRWRQLSGRAATLLTGHWLIDLREQEASAGPRARPGVRGIGETGATTVRFATVSEADIEDYVATGEPLRAAGCFTIDGLGGPFIDGVDGDPHNVVGLSLPLLRGLLERLELRWSMLWRPTATHATNVRLDAERAIDPHGSRQRSRAS